MVYFLTSLSAIRYNNIKLFSKCIHVIFIDQSLKNTVGVTILSVVVKVRVEIARVGIVLEKALYLINVLLILLYMVRLTGFQHWFRPWLYAE